MNRIRTENDALGTPPGPVARTPHLLLQAGGQSPGRKLRSHKLHRAEEKKRKTLRSLSKRRWALETATNLVLATESHLTPHNQRPTFLLLFTVKAGYLA